MASTTIVFGLLLTLLGFAGYFATGTSSLTALIPALFGLLLVVLGFVGRAEHARKHAMHGAAMIGVLGLITAVLSLVITPPGLRPALAVNAEIAMALLTAVFVALCVRSFIAAKRARAARQ